MTSDVFLKHFIGYESDKGDFYKVKDIIKDIIALLKRSF
jgi:hypothetical protein